MRIDNSQNIAKINQALSSKVNANSKELKQLRVLTKQVHQALKEVRAQQVLQNAPGPMPVTGQFTIQSSGPCLLLASGSGYFGVPAEIGMVISVDGTQRGLSQCYTNEATSHKSFVPTFVLLDLPSGSHTVTLSQYGSTSSDSNDRYSVTILEM